jgi:oligosaccharide repeat unit polymerase
MSRVDKLLFNILQCIFLLALYGTLYFYKNDLVLIVSFFYSLVFGFQAINQRLKTTLTNNSSLIFLLFLFLYGIFNCIISYGLNGEIIHNIYIATVIYAATIPAYIIAVLLIKPTDYASHYLSNVSQINVSKGYQYFVILALFLLLAFKSYTLQRQGLFFNYALTKSVSRIDLFTEINQSDILAGLLINASFLFFIFYFFALNPKVKIILVILFLYFVAMNMSLGNRRDFAPMVIGIFWVLSCKYKFKFSLAWFLLLICGIFVFLVLGSLRSANESESYLDIVNQTLSSNEFVYPFFTLARPVEDYLNGTQEFLYGTSIFLYPIFFFIPRAIFIDKPYSLASQFVLDYYGGGMGYAYTPVSEGFLNFGPIGPAILYFFIGLSITKLQFRRDQRAIFIFFSMIPDLCRGEISTFIYQYVFTIAFLILIPKLFELFFEFKLINRSPVSLPLNTSS